MKKKLVGTFLATALILAQVASAAASSISTPPVTAAPAPTLTPEQEETEKVKEEIKETVTKDSEKVVTEVKITSGKYEAKMAVIDTTQPITKEVVTEATREVFGYVEKAAPQVFNAIVDINQAFSEYMGQLSTLTSAVSVLPGVPGLTADGKELTKNELKELFETVKQLKKDISKKLDVLIDVSSEGMTAEEIEAVKAVTATKEPASMPFDLNSIDGGVIDADGMHNITMDNQNLTDEEHFDGTVLLLIDMENKTSKIVEPEVDYENKEMTFKTENLGIGVLMVDKDAEEE